MTIAVPQDVDTLDPHKKDAFISVAVLSHIYEGLVTTDPEMTLQPALALRWESPDPTTWIFRLRPGVVFQDGRPMSAADVVYSLERARTGDLEMKTYLFDVTGVQALDDMSVEVRTANPDRVFLKRLAYVPIVSAGATGETLESSANGTGPYAVTEWRRIESLRLRRNERYWGRRPAVRDVRFRFGVNTSDAIAGLLAGEYQLIQADSKTIRSALGTRSRYETFRTPSLFVPYLGYDLSRGVTPFCGAERNPFRDRRVRRALDLAIDRKSLAAGLSTDAVPASQLVPRSVFGYSPSIPESVHDTGTARALLAEAGFAGGFRIVLHARPFFQEAAFSIRDQLREVGIDVEPRFLTAGEYFAAAQRRELSFWIGSFGCGTGDASELLNNMVHSTDSTGRWGGLNVGGYANPGLDRAIEASAAIETSADRRKALDRLMQTVAEERVVLPLYAAQDGHALERSFLWRPRSDGYIRAAEVEIAR